jgi:hypothetical protein
LFGNFTKVKWHKLILTFQNAPNFNDFEKGSFKLLPSLLMKILYDIHNEKKPYIELNFGKDFSCCGNMATTHLVITNYLKCRKLSC